jgi:cellulose synthase/poly-beta-1,6-N-acetylglucosamine synthase-like glycosyltransferase
MKISKYAFAAAFIVAAGFLAGCQSLFPGLTKVDLQPLQEQPYDLVYNEVIDGNPVRRLLVITSADPADVETYEYILRRNDDLAQIIASHWAVTVDVIQVSDYTEGMINNYDALFLIEDQDKIPVIVMDDIVSADNKEIIFAGYGSGNLLSHVVRDLWSPESEAALVAVPPPPASVLYKGEIFSPSELNILSVFPPLRSSEDIEVNVLATYQDNEGGEHPLIVDVADRYLIIPFELPSYYSPDDYSLVFLDTLHYALGHHEANRIALVRLEDVNPYVYRSTAKLRDAYEYLRQEQIPFQIALIARYINPEKHIDLYTHEARRYLRYLKRMVGEGLGIIVQHGYTHQTTGISSIDYEYWDEETDGPLAYDTEDYVLSTLEGAQSEMSYLDLPIPDIFETPHYALSDLDNRIVSRYYPLRYEHIPDIGSLPIVASIDDRIYFPTNLGYVATWDDIEPYEKADLLAHISVFEDPVASFFWHPWRDVAELQYMVDLLRGEGYEFVSVYDLVTAGEAAGYNDIVAFREGFKPNLFTLNNLIIDILLAVVYLGFFSGSVIYTLNVIRIARYQKDIQRWKLSLDEVRALARENSRELPNLGILVPARNEGYVIGNTIRRLVAMDYPKEHYRVYIIVDERELDDDVEILTKDTAYELAAQVRVETGIDLVRVIEVPKWYSGEFGNLRYSDRKSTKGRALNFALETLRESPEWDRLELFGILDADGRLDPHVLKEIAYRRIKDGSKILQGSVFQVSNYSQVSIVGVAAGLELAIHHLTVLPTRMLKRKVQFLAGTNYFIDKDVMLTVQGWNQTSLVEDAELALRIYVTEDAIAEWIRSPELEQSPANFRVYRRQRERWARGHLLLLKDIRQADIPWRDKATFYFKVFMSQFRFLIDVGLILISLVMISVGAFAYLSPLLKWMSIFLALMSIFIMDIYGLMYRRLSQYINPQMTFWQKVLQSLKLFSYFPILIFVQAIPRAIALWNYLFKRETSWYKTERTKEAIADPAKNM